ncbi:transglutaminase domain-containing protein [Roseivirga sp.]|uniref:transglutaminase domain-containing protein n=1 Tax=Roseivirga sp. TaxID=1964215 RepID=UPI003B527896
MKRTLILIVLLWASLFTLKAQTQKIQLGAPSQEELQMTSFDKDPEAEAVVLYDKGSSYFHFDQERGYVIQFTRTKRIKILTEAGKDYGNIEIQAYKNSADSRERITSFKAFSHNLSLGSVEKREVGLDDIYEEEINAYWSLFKVAIPNVKPGTIIEYEYVLETPFLSNPPDWKFQNRIPTVYSEYVLNAIPFYEYTFAAQGIRRFDYRNSKTSSVDRTFGSVVESYGRNIGSGVKFNDVIHTFVMKDLPAFRDEEYITSVEDYIQKLDFQLAVVHRPTGSSEELMTDWNTMIATLLDSRYIGKYMDDSEKAAKKEILKEIDLGNGSNLEKSISIVNHFKDNYRWNELAGKGTSNKAKDVIESKTGNVGELNLLLIGTLRAAGITAKPVILSTRNNGKIKKEFPYDPAFNYVIVMVEADGKAFLADVTEPLLSFDRIPIRAINDNGLILEETAPWIDLRVNPLSQNIRQFEIKLNPESSKASVVLNNQLTEFEAYRSKITYDDDTDKIKEYYEKRGFEVTDEIKTANYNRSRAPYLIQTNIDFDLGQLDGKLFFSPFLHFPISENNLTQKERTYPIDLIYPISNSYEASILIPEGYELIQNVESYDLSTPLISIDVKSEIEGNMLKITGEYTFKKAIYEPNEYSALKNQINLIIEKFNQEVVLEKKEQ